MAKILFISEKIPLPDQASGDLRFFSLMKILAGSNEIHLAVFGYPAQQDKLGKEQFNNYLTRLSNAGIHVHLGQVLGLLRHWRWDLIVFEFYHAARPSWIVEARYHNPQVKLVIDSVDIHFKRLHEKAKVTGSREDYTRAEQTRQEELAAYENTDFILAVSDSDRDILLKHLPQTTAVVVPNIHSIHTPDIQPPNGICRLVFVGGFQHDPNIDAVLYFCQDIFPRLATKIPVQIDIIGSSPPPQIRRLHGGQIHVLGFVENTLPYLKRSHISIAPLRYGAGMKGKVGEAMAAGLPVVTTSVGAEGFGFTPGEHVLIGDTADTFAEHIITLYTNQMLHEKIRLAGWNFIRTHYSEESLAPVLSKTFTRMEALKPKYLPLRKRLAKFLAIEYQRHLAWRFK